jgi:hypothetical protein
VVDLSAEPLDHVGVAEALDTGVRVGSGDVQGLGELADRHTPVAAEFGEDPAVDVVESTGHVSSPPRPNDRSAGHLASYGPPPGPEFSNSADFWNTVT